MSFLSGHDKVKCILGVALTNNKKYVALIEETEESEAQQVRFDWGKGICVTIKCSMCFERGAGVSGIWVV